MHKRVLHTAQQILTHVETNTEPVIENTVNAPAEVRVKGDSWQQSTDGVNVYSGGSITMTWENAEDGSIGLNGGSKSFRLNCGDIFQNGGFLSFDCDMDVPITACIEFGGLGVTNWSGSNLTYIKKGENRITLSGYEFIEGQTGVKIQIRKNNIGESIGTPHTFTLSNILVKSGQDEHDYEPYSGGMPSPDPEYPQEIISVSGILKSTNNCLGGRDKLRDSQITIPELRAIPGTDIRDEMVVYEDGTGKIVRRVDKKYFSDFKNINLSTEKENTQVFQFQIPNTAFKITRIECLCTHFISQAQGDVPTIKITPSNNSIYFALYKSEVSTLDELKAWIERNNPCLLYCAEPTEEPLTADQVQGILRTHQYHTEIQWEGLDEHLNPEVSIVARQIGRV